ncbi:MAG: 16S rRNA (uracil(1498)-N(3))-methyltransferase [Clostridiales bacterium]|nr:16S rRNA (uracil(1498)-N(3))-methyltransferase [Clostridiales bacterium]
MTRLFSNVRVDPATDTLLLDEKDSRYIRDVLRMRTGESLTVCDLDRMEFEAIIADPSEKQIQLRLFPGTPNRTEPPYEAVIYQGLPKGDKMSTVIQKSVELGTFGICPISCSRSIVKISKRDSSAKTKRWQTVSLEAARQSGRGIVPEIKETTAFFNAAEDACQTSDLVIIPWEDERLVSLFEVLESFAERYGYMPVPISEKGADRKALISEDRQKLPRISVFIGPEGGFDDEEVEYARSRGAVPVSLGKRILRTETAGPAVLAMLLYRLELV